MASNENGSSTSTVWHLIEVLRENSDDNDPEYCIVRSTDIAEGSASNANVQGIVQFYRHSLRTEGKIILTSRNRNAANKRMKDLVAAHTIANLFITTEKLYLVQFSKGNRDVVHAVIPQKNVSWSPDYQLQQRRIIIDDGNRKHLAHLLCYSDNKEHVLSEFQKLKQWSFEKTYNPKDFRQSVDDDEWLLVMYTCGKSNMVYTIMNNRQTLSKHRNAKNDAITYTTDGQNVYRMIVIQKSHNLDFLLQCLNYLKIQCPMLSFPMDVDDHCPLAVPPVGFNSLCGSLTDFVSHRDSNNAERELPGLCELESNMKEEAAILMETINVLKNAKNAIKKKL